MKSAPSKIDTAILKAVTNPVLLIAAALRRDLADLPQNPTPEELDRLDGWDGRYYNYNLEKSLLIHMLLIGTVKPERQNSYNLIILYSLSIIVDVLKVNDDKPLPGLVDSYKALTSFSGTEHIETLRLLLLGDPQAYEKHYGRPPTEAELANYKQQVRDTLIHTQNALQEMLRLLGDNYLAVGGNREGHLHTQNDLLKGYFSKVEEEGKWINPYDSVKKVCPKISAWKSERWDQPAQAKETTWAERFADMGSGCFKRLGL
jgi:hypothetical protein